MSWVVQGAPEPNVTTDERGAALADSAARGIYIDVDTGLSVFYPQVVFWTPVERSTI